MATSDGDPENPLDDIPDDDLETAATVIQRLVDAGEIDPDSPTGRLSRRDLLAGAGALLGGGASTQLAGDARAGSQQSGTVGTASRPVDVEADDVNAEEVGDILLAEPGELQSKLSSATSGDEVWAINGAHDPGSETTVPQGVTLRWLDATFEPTSNYNGFFVDLGAEILGPMYADLSGIGTSYTSDVVVLDSGRAGDRYSIENQNEVTVEAVVHQAINAGTGTALHLRADSAGSISVGNHFRVISKYCDTGIDIDTVGSFVQGGIADVYLKGNATADIRHHGGNNAGGLLIRGVIQADGNAAVGISKETTSSLGPVFHGQWYDPSSYATNAITGDRVTVDLVQPGASPRNFIGNTDSGFDTAVHARKLADMTVYAAQEDNAYRLRFDDSFIDMEIDTDGTGWNRRYNFDFTTGDVNAEGTFNGSQTL